MVRPSPHMWATDISGRREGNRCAGEGKMAPEARGRTAVGMKECWLLHITSVQNESGDFGFCVFLLICHDGGCGCSFSSFSCPCRLSLARLCGMLSTSILPCLKCRSSHTFLIFFTVSCSHSSVHPAVLGRSCKKECLSK